MKTKEIVNLTYVKEIVQNNKDYFNKLGINVNAFTDKDFEDVEYFIDMIKRNNGAVEDFGFEPELIQLANTIYHHFLYINFYSLKKNSVKGKVKKFLFSKEFKVIIPDCNLKGKVYWNLTKIASDRGITKLQLQGIIEKLEDSNYLKRLAVNDLDFLTGNIFSDKKTTLEVLKSLPISEDYNYIMNEVENENSEYNRKEYSEEHKENRKELRKKQKLINKEFTKLMYSHVYNAEMPRATMEIWNQLYAGLYLSSMKTNDIIGAKAKAMVSKGYSGKSKDFFDYISDEELIALIFNMNRIVEKIKIKGKMNVDNFKNICYTTSEKTNKAVKEILGKNLIDIPIGPIEKEILANKNK